MKIYYKAFVLHVIGIKAVKYRESLLLLENLSCINKGFSNGVQSLTIFANNSILGVFDCEGQSALSPTLSGKSD